MLSIGNYPKVSCRHRAASVEASSSPAS